MSACGQKKESPFGSRRSRIHRQRGRSKHRSPVFHAAEMPGDCHSSSGEHTTPQQKRKILEEKIAFEAKRSERRQEKSGSKCRYLLAPGAIASKYLHAKPRRTSPLETVFALLPRADQGTPPRSRSTNLLARRYPGRYNPTNR